MADGRQLPLRPLSHQLEELSARFFRNRLPTSWLCDKPAGDYGVDLRVDLFDGDAATGLELLVQLKASTEPDGTVDESIRLRKSTYNYLTNKLQVVILVKFILKENEAYWMYLKDVPRPEDGVDAFSVRIPRQNRLSAIDWSAVYSHVRDVSDRKRVAERRWQLEHMPRADMRDTI